MLAIVARIQWSGLVRLAAVTATVAGLTLAIALVYPVQRELDTSGQARAQYVSFSDAELDLDDIRVAEAMLAPYRVFVAGAYVGELSVSGSPHGVAADIYVTPTPGASEVGWFSPATRVSSTKVPFGVPWIDLSADLARELGAEPGDSVAFKLSPHVAVDYTVRSIHAIRLDAQNGWVAQASFEEDLWAESKTVPLFNIVLTDAPTESAIEVLGEGRFREALIEGGYVDDLGELNARIALDRQVFVDSAERHSNATLSLIGAVSLLAAVGGAVFVTREVLIQRARALPTLALISVLGGSPAAVRKSSSLMTALAIATGFVVAYPAATAPYYMGLLGPAMPQAIVSAVVATLCSAVILSLALVSVLHARSARSEP